MTTAPTSSESLPEKAATKPKGPFPGRAALALLVWVVGVAPAAAGIKRCTIAAVFHVPCPGCGLTRSAHSLMDGHVIESLRMHPLLVPILLSNSLVALATIVATWKDGSPFYFYRDRLGRFTLWFVGIVYALAIIVWIARFFGLLGGPVPV